MDLSFTKDSSWIVKRNELWLPLEEQLNDGYSKREIAKWKAYFFTGQVPSGIKIHPAALLENFPVFNMESVEYCFKNLISEKIPNSEYEFLQGMFFGGLLYVPGLSFEEKAQWFYDIYGDHYEPNRVFPFLIGNEAAYRSITIKPPDMFEATMDVRSWLCGEEAHSHWNVYREYFFSLLPYVDETVFTVPKRRNNLEGRIGIVNAKLIALMKLCFKYQDPDPSSPQSAARHDYLAFFRNRMDNLDHYPGDLKALWEHIKAEHS